MATAVELRCPRCGGRLTAYTTYPQITAVTRCPHCGTVLPFVAPRDPAPLYSWEVYPGLYPPAPLPRPPSPWRRPAIVGLLLAVTLLLAGLGGAFAWLGGDALRPGVLTVGGTISPGSAPAAWVSIDGENGFTVNKTVVGGVFSIPNVPYGGVVLTAGATGYTTLQVDLFLSPVYSSITGSPTQLELTLTPSNGSSLYVIDTTAFPDLETFVASLWSGSGLLWVGALFTGLGGVAARRDRAPWVILGGASAMAAPFALPLIGIDGVSQALTASALAALPAGLIVLLLALPQFARAQSPVEPI